MVTSLAGFESGPESVVGLLAGFAGGSFPPAARRADRNAGRFQVPSGRFPPDSGGLFDAPQRPAELAQGDNLFLFLVAQDIAHVAEDRPPPSFSMS